MFSCAFLRFAHDSAKFTESLQRMNNLFHTRREFLKRASTAAIAAPFVATLVSTMRAAESEKKLGFALVGLGGLSSGQLAPAFR